MDPEISSYLYTAQHKKISGFFRIAGFYVRAGRFDLRTTDLFIYLVHF